MIKLLAMGMSSLLGLAMASAFEPPPPPGPGDPPPPKKKHEKGADPKKKHDKGPEGDLRRAYDLLRRIRSDNRTVGRPEDRLREWTDRATKLYRDGLRAHAEGDLRLAHEYGAAAHDLARTVEHARNAALFDGPDSDLPPPPAEDDRDGGEGRVRFDLRHAYDRVRDALDDHSVPETKFYVDAARDLYNAARRDAAGGRNERAGELARAAEAITHVPEHLAHAANLPDEAGRKEERDVRKRPPRPSEFDDRKPERPEVDLPPPL